MPSASARGCSAGTASCARSRRGRSPTRTPRPRCCRSWTAWRRRSARSSCPCPIPTSSTPCATISIWCARVCGAEPGEDRPGAPTMPGMISREPTLARLVAARSQLLEPYGLSEPVLAKALRLITEHRVDDADLYFQTTRSEGWSLEEGIVKSGSFSIDQGVGVRAVAGEKTAFAYSDDISEAALMDAARTVRTIAAAGQSRKVKVPATAHVLCVDT
eukprot:Opistho-1_new@31734